MSKYDCSSADLNPIGGMCKGDLKRMLIWVSDKYKVDVLKEIANAAPTVCFRLRQYIIISDEFYHDIG